jgi:hypothetical protein
VANSGGNDANSGTSPSTAWNTISKVNSKAFNSGDIISFKCGDRFSDATLIPPISFLTFNSYGSGSRPVIDGLSSRKCVDMLNYTRNNITFTGLKFVNGFQNNIVMWYCNNITFESCNIDSSKGGTITYSNIYAGQGSNLVVRNSTISYGAQSTGFDGNLGIYLDGSDNAILEHDTLIGSFSNIRVAFGTSDLGMANGLIVRYCVVKNGRYDNVDEDGSNGAQYYYNIFEATNINVYLFTDGSGSYDAYATRNSSYYNNTFITHGSEASIHLNSQTGVNNGMVFKNNIFYSDNSSGYFFYEEVSGQMGTWTFSNNLYYMTSSTTHGWVRHGVTYSSLSQWQSIGYDASSLATNPLFTNYTARDLTLQSTSKAIDSGTFVGLTCDIKGTPVTPTYPDLGAFEHSSSLPVELTSFNAHYINNSVHLNWSTATEINNQGFEIERNVNTNWEKIGFINGKGNSVTRNDYSFEDKNPVGSTTQYRLKQIDNDGNFKYSDIVEVVASPQSFSIGNYPNPFNPSTKIRYSIPSESLINVKIYNVLGEKIDELRNDIQQPGNYEINWSASNHPSGIYLLSIVESPTNGSAKISKTIKMNLMK